VPTSTRTKIWPFIGFVPPCGNVQKPSVAGHFGMRSEGAVYEAHAPLKRILRYLIFPSNAVVAALDARARLGPGYENF
jgi:hypothetical protein